MFLMVDVGLHFLFKSLVVKDWSDLHQALITVMEALLLKCKFSLFQLFGHLLVVALEGLLHPFDISHSQSTVVGSRATSTWWSYLG